jgi:hypothetical protein
MYFERQYGWILIMMMVFFLVLMSFVFLLELGSNPLPGLGFALIVVIMVTVIELFYKMETKIDEHEILITYGIGWIKKTIKLDRIATVRVVRNKWYYGLGIRLLPKGTMYNIHGLDAVELYFYDTSRIIRIGTAMPEQLAAHIQGKIR